MNKDGMNRLALPTADIRNHLTGVADALETMVQQTLTVLSQAVEKSGGSANLPIPLVKWPYPWPSVSTLRKWSSDIGHDPEHPLRDAFIRIGETVCVDPAVLIDRLRDNSKQEWSRVWQKNLAWRRK